MRVESWALTDVGRVRKHNEDGWLIDEQLGLYAVADGMGGHAAGEVASAYGLRCVQEQLGQRKELIDEFVRQPTPELAQKILREIELAVNVASSAIYGMGQREEQRRGMGTTLSVLLVAGRKGFMAHVGDSRIYMVRSGQIHQLSEDHSYLWEQVKKGLLTKQQAKASRLSNVITRAVGITETVQVDTLVFDIVPGDTFLICSDGLHGAVGEENELLAHLLDAEPNLIPQRLVDLANARGGKDNITCLVLRAPGDADDPKTQELIEKLDILKEIPLFRHLNYKELVKVLNLTQPRNYEAGAVVIEEDSEGDEFFVILSGEVSVNKHGRTLTTLGGRVHFGEMALVDQSPRSATVRAERATRTLCLSRPAFFAVVRTEPALGSKLLWSFVQVLSHRLRIANDVISKEQTDKLAVTPMDDVGMATPMDELPHPIDSDE
ncbi:MAG: cyclic nucleotide-binding domain-containing protein [Myxococcota bacterium]